MCRKTLVATPKVNSFIGTSSRRLFSGQSSLRKVLLEEALKAGGRRTLSQAGQHH